MSSILERHRERFRSAPGDDRAFEALEEHSFLAGEWPEVLGLYEHRLTAPSLQADAAARSQILYRMGQVREERLDDPESAAECYRRALGANPQHRPALSRLRQLSSARGQWDVALQIAEVEVGLPMPVEERASVLAAMGDIWLAQLDEPEQALGHYERALEEDPEQTAALAGAARVYERTAEVRKAAETWERLSALQRGAQRAPTLVALARLYEGPLVQRERAAELYRRALSDDPRNPDAVEALAQRAGERGQWDLLTDLQERRFELCDDDDRRVELALEAGRIELRELAAPAAARVWLLRAAELRPEDPRVHEMLAEIARGHGDDEALSQSLQRLVELQRDDAPVSALIEVAALASGRGDDERALGYLRRALERSPDDVQILESISDALTRLGRDEERAELLERRAALAGADPAARAALLAQLGALYEERLDDAEAAREAYERAFGDDPAQPGVASALERMHRKAEDWDALRALLETAGQRGPAPERASALCSLGELLAERFDDAGGAARALEAALALDPEADGAHAALQTLAVASGDPDAVLRAYEREAATTRDRGRLSDLVMEIARMREARGEPDAALGWIERWVESAPEEPAALIAAARLYELLGRGEDLRRTLERLDPMLQGRELAANRRRLASSHAAEDRPEAAINAFEAALEANPADLESLEALGSLYERTNRPEELAATLARLADVLPPVRRRDCLDRLARLRAERLGDVSGAIEILSRLAFEGGGDDVLERLEALLERAGRYEELAALLERRAEGAADEAAAVDFARRRADVLLERLDRFDEAARAYRAVLELDPGSAPAQDGLERAVRASGDTEALSAFLMERMNAADDAATRERCGFELATLAEEVLGRDGDARSTYEWLSRTASDPALRARARARLGALLERTGAWVALREHLEASLEQADDPLALHEQLAQLNRNRFDERDRAVRHFEAATALAPERGDLWRALAQLYHEAGETEKLVSAMEAEIAAGAEPGREVTLHCRAAEILSRELFLVDRARVHYERVLELEPTHSAAAEFLMDHWERGGRLDDVVRLLEVRLSALDAEPRDEGGVWAARRASLRLRMAALRAGPLEDLDGAIAALEPALGELGYQPAVAEPLADLYQRAGHGEDLVALCRRTAEACREPAERAQWSARLGESLRSIGQEREAVAAFREALGQRPDDRDTQAALRDLYRRLGDSDALARCLEAELSHLAGSDEIPTRLELADLLAGPLGRPVDALVQLRRVLQISPGRRDAFDRALALAEEREDSAAVIELLDTALVRPQRDAQRAELLARRASLLARHPGRLPEAVTAYREALALEPGRGADRAALREVLDTLGDWEGVLDCLYEEASRAGDGERARIYERAANTAEERLSLEAALPWLERLRGERPRDARVAARFSDAQRRLGRTQALLRALETEIELADDDAARRFELHLERARVLQEDCGSPGRAAAALEDACRTLPGNVRALRQLEQLYRSLGRPRQRAAILEELLACDREAERITLHCEAAALYEGPIGDPERAAGHLRAAAAAAPRDSGMYTELLRALGEALRRSGPPDAWASCAEEELSALDPGTPVFADRRRTLRRELAAVYEHELSRPAEALRHLRALVDGEPADGDPRDVEAAETALLRLLRAEGNDVELARRLAVHLARRPDADGWLELARLRDELLRSPAGAAEAYRRASELAPDCRDALRGLRSAAERLGDWDEVTGALERELDLERDDRRRAALLRRLGDLCWHRLEATTRASRFYAAALEADSSDFPSLRSLEQLLEAMEDWRGALDLYESEVEALGEREPGRRVEAALRAGAIARDRTDEPERALRAYVYAANHAELPPERRAELAELYARCGDRGSFAEVFGAWCEDPESGAGGADWLRLARALAELGRTDEALARAERAAELSPDPTACWEEVARLRQQRGDAAGAADALERFASSCGNGAEASDRLHRAAMLVEGDDLQRAEALLTEAAQRDGANPAAHAALARVAEARGEPARAILAASRALDLPLRGGALDAEARTRVALIGGRCARERGEWEEAARFYTRALEIAPGHPELLARAGETLAELGDLAGAASALEARLALDEPDPERALHLALLGEALEAEDRMEAALARFEEALAAEPGEARAHAGLVRRLEAAGRVDDGVAALERWADAAAAPAERAERLLRAARWELAAGGRAEAAERHLREALDARPEEAEAWELLAQRLWDAERPEEALEVATLALETLSEDAPRAALSLLRARALERRGDRAEAADAYAAAIALDPRSGEAALARARLLRGLGEWSAAAEALRAFADADPGDDAEPLAEVLQQLGRLLAGPLEDVSGAADAYRRAIAVDPTRAEPRAALAEFLSHRPEDWQEALAQHRALLDADPTRAASLRSVARIAEQRGDREASARGREILSALGIASPQEREAATRSSVSYSGRRELDDPLWEKLRAAVQGCSRELTEALDASEPGAGATGGDAAADFRSATLEAEGRFGAPALLPLPASELGEVIRVLAALGLQAEQARGEGRRINALSEALKRRARKRLRRELEGESLETVGEIDFAAWRDEVRALAAAVALEETGAALRTALRALAAEDAPDPEGELADLTPLVQASPVARALLRRVTGAWVAHLGGELA